MVNKNETFKVKEPKWSKFFSRISWILTSFMREWKEYGFPVAWHGFVWWLSIYIKMPRLSAKALSLSTKSIDSFFTHNYADVLNRYVNSNQSRLEMDISIEKYPIWCFWWQGEQKMPHVVRVCYNNIKKNNNNVTLITQENIREIVKIPEEIYNKVSEGKISFTHLSDILRLTLLAEYGGMWIDVTCYNPYMIPNYAKQLPFCSPHDTMKQQNRTQITYWCDLGGWRSWNIGTNKKNSTLFCFCRDMIHTIAVRQNCMPSYFMVDCLLSYAYRNIAGVKMMIDNLPDINTKCADLFLSYFNTNKLWNEFEYQELIKNDWLFKLTYKTIWKDKVNGQLTFYGKLFENN